MSSEIEVISQRLVLSNCVKKMSVLRCILVLSMLLAPGVFWMFLAQHRMNLPQTFLSENHAVCTCKPVPLRKDDGSSYATYRNHTVCTCKSIPLREDDGSSYPTETNHTVCTCKSVPLRKDDGSSYATNRNQTVCTCKSIPLREDDGSYTIALTTDMKSVKKEKVKPESIVLTTDMKSVKKEKVKPESIALTTDMKSVKKEKVKPESIALTTDMKSVKKEKVKPESIALRTDMKSVKKEKVKRESDTSAKRVIFLKDRSPVYVSDFNIFSFEDQDDFQQLFPAHSDDTPVFDPVSYRSFIEAENFRNLYLMEDEKDFEFDDEDEGIQAEDFDLLLSKDYDGSTLEIPIINSEDAHDYEPIDFSPEVEEIKSTDGDHDVKMDRNVV